MNQHPPRMQGNDVSFTVIVDSLHHECLIKEEALHRLSAMKNTDGPAASTMEVFHAFEGTINGVARRLVAARVQGTPVVLTANTFFGPPRP